MMRFIVTWSEKTQVAMYKSLLVSSPEHVGRFRTNLRFLRMDANSSRQQKLIAGR